MSQGGAEEDVKRCIREVREVLFICILSGKKNILRRTKLKLFNSSVKSVLLYGCET
jgi:hypothetical protein